MFRRNHLNVTLRQLNTFSVHRHIILTKHSGLNIDLISNDNAFLNTFDGPSPFMQRTLFTRLGNASEDPIFITKPIFHLWTMLGLLGMSVTFYATVK